jgi:hypothetical protein
MPDIPQPWKYLTIYDRDEPEVDIPALAPLFANYRAEGLTIPDSTERIYTYRMYLNCRLSKNWKPGPFSHMMFLLANFPLGRNLERRTNIGVCFSDGRHGLHRRRRRRIPATGRPWRAWAGKVRGRRG